MRLILLHKLTPLSILDLVAENLISEYFNSEIPLMND